MRHFLTPVLNLLLTGAAITLPASAQAIQASAEQGSTPGNPIASRPDGFELRTLTALIRVTALTDAIIRVRIGRAGTLDEDSSWAVPKEVRAKTVHVAQTTDGFTTAALRVRIDPATMRLRVEDRAGKLITEDQAGPVALDGRAFTLRKLLARNEHVFGLGDKTGGSLDRREHSFVDWNTDAFGYSSGSDPVYKSIPFYVSVRSDGGSYGLLLDNSWRSWFDIGHRDEGTIAMGAPDGPIDYYVIAGPSTAEVVRRYTDLTGKAPLTPQWALGFQQSRYSYMSADEVRQIAGRLRSDRIPTDVIWLDIDYQDRNRPFTVNKQTFPDLAGLARDMRQKGIRLVTIADLHVAALPQQGYAPFDTGKAGNHFVHNPDGSTYVAPVWPGPSVFPDFTRSDTRRWWGGLHRGLLDAGASGIWNDMNEPAIFETATKTMPLDVVHRIETDDFATRSASHSEIHNVYGQQNTRATFEGLTRLRPDERPFVMTRASYAGGQRYAVTWTGDNTSSWDHLRLSVQQLLNLGLSGFSYAGADVGGFTGGPSPDLLTRWIEIAAFTPIFRDHSAKNTPRAEPWVDGPAHLAIRRRFIEERYRLMPYLYGLADENARLGDPLMRPVFYDYPAAINASCDQSMSFTLGAKLLVAAAPKPESPQDYDICLPAGGWYDYWTGLPVVGANRGEQEIQSATQATGQQQARNLVISETPRLDRLPVFVRAGTILPRQALVQSTAEKPAGPLELHVYPGADCSGALYADDGHSMAYKRGGYLRQTVRCTIDANGIAIAFERRQGSYRPWWPAMQVVVHDWQGPTRVARGRQVIASQADADARTLRFTIPDQPGAATIQLSRGRS